MDQERMGRVTAEVMDSLKLAISETNIAERYVKRAVNKILIFCNRTDFPEMLEDTAAQIAEDMIRADMIKAPEKDVASITRGDTSISYKDDSFTRQQSINFMKNYETTLVRYKKPNLPKDKRNE